MTSRTSTSTLSEAIFLGTPPGIHYNTASIDTPLWIATKYILDLVRDGDILQAVADMGVQALRYLRSCVENLQIPIISPGVDGLLGMTWRNQRHYVNVQFFSDGHVEYFSEDLSTGAMWLEEQPSFAPTPPLIEQLVRTIG